MRNLKLPATKLIGIFLLQALILLSIFAFKQYTIWTSETILLQVEELRPPNFEAGQYLTARYEISTIDSFDRNSDGGAFYDTVFVELADGDDGFWHAVAIHDRREREESGTVLIKGKVWSPYYDPDARLIDYATYEIRYGIEDFIVAASGASSAQSEVAVEVRVDRFGEATPLRLLIDGRPTDIDLP